MSQTKTLEVPVKGMDCADCTRHVQHALAELPGVQDVTVYLAGEKAKIQFDPDLTDLPAMRRAVKAAGYEIPENLPTPPQTNNLQNFTRPVLTLFGIVFGAVLFIIVFGEWLGLFEKITTGVPFPVGLLIVLLFGWPVFANVVRATLRRQVISHTLMTIGVIAALAVGEWATAVVVVFFMRIGDYAERFTTERARRAMLDLTALAPQTARVERGGQETEVPVEAVNVGEVVIVRPGEMIPVDGEVLEGLAAIDQAAITGEAMPVEASPGSRVFAASIAREGSLRVSATHTGTDSTIGRVIQMVEEAETNRADVQRIGDRFSAAYLPVVAGIALITFLIRRDPLATAAVLLVACSCSFALATPIAMLASIGAAAKHGLLIKGGRYIELLAQADTLLIDKTGTLTLGQPQITDILPLDGANADELLRQAAAAERYSEHPLGEAVRRAARERNFSRSDARDFSSTPGIGVQAQVDGRLVQVGSVRLLDGADVPAAAAGWLAQGKTLLVVRVDGQLAGLLAAADILRPDVPQALAELRALGIRRIELLTGDHTRAAQAVAEPLGIDFRANLLPEDKIRIVCDYQAQGRTVVMVGDGVNDAPALAQAQVGIAMGAGGTDIAIEAAHIALMRDDWTLLPRVLRIARRTMRTVKLNLGFTAAYNIVGLTLAAFGFLPPILAAAAQSLPDLGILGNSSRLLKQD